MEPLPVTTVADARASLSRILRTFRDDPNAPGVVIGSHRAPEAVIVPFSQVVGDAIDKKRPALPLLERLRSKRDLITRIAAMNTLTDIRVFGSVARGDETDESDVDLLVQPTDGSTLFDLAQFAIDMESLLEREVDVVSIRSLDAERDSRILAEAVPL